MQLPKFLISIELYLELKDPPLQHYKPTQMNSKPENNEEA
jgi:hypothetical protein